MIHFTSFILLPCLLLTLERSAVARTGPSQQPSHVGLRSAPNPFQSARFQPSSTIQGLGTASIGADVIYNNTSPTGLYVPLLPGESVWDSGYLSGPGFPWVTWFGPGCASSYTVTGLEFGYVTDQPTADIELYFKHQYDTCQAVVPVPDHVLSLNGLPGSTNGAITGWIITLDLRNTPGLTPFDLFASGDGTFSGMNWTGNLFGYGIKFLNASPAGNTGPIAAGDGFGVSGRGVRWSNASVDYSATSAAPGNSPSMAHFPSLFCDDYYPYAIGPHLRLFADACGALVGEAVCLGDGSGTSCPCGNSSPSANREGCRSSINGVNGARLEGLGLPSISQDSFFLRAHRLPATTTTLFFQGTAVLAGGSGVPFGDGLRCVGGSVIRLGTKLAANGQAEYPVAQDPRVSVIGGITLPGTRFYQAWYRNSADFCTPSTFNLSNGWRVDWAL